MSAYLYVCLMCAGMRGAKGLQDVALLSSLLLSAPTAGFMFLVLFGAR
jgi:hypothetical protein